MMKIKDLTIPAVFTAIMCIISPFSLLLGVVPISLASFAVYLCAGLLGAKKGTAAIALYVALGAVGLPVFSGFEGGISKIAGLTGGFILGYIPCGFIVGIMTEKIRGKWAYPVSMAVGTAVCYLLGIIWFVFQTNTDFFSAFLTCVLPFLVGDSVKVAAASFLCIKTKKNILKG